MLIASHKQARTTQHVLAQIAASDEPVAVLARRYGVTAPKQARPARTKAKTKTTPRPTTKKGRIR